MTTPPCKCFSTVQVKYTLYAVSDFHQLMKCNDHQLLQISGLFGIIMACCHVEKK